MRRTITNPHGETIDYKFHRGAVRSKKKPKKEERPHALLIGHGVTGDLERPVLEELARAVSQAGIHALRFSFSGNGASGGKFGDATISKEVEDLGAVIDAATDAGYDVSYAGHSMGAAVGIIRATEDDRLHNLVCLAPMIHTRRFVDAEFGEVTPGKGNMWGEKGCRLTTAFVDDLKSIDTVLPKMSEVHIPVYIIHGADDDVIPWAEARAAYDFANEPKKLSQISGTGHTFEGKAAEVLSKAVTSWLVASLKTQKKEAKEAEKRERVAARAAARAKKSVRSAAPKTSR